MDLPPILVHECSRYLGVPIINAGKQCKDGSGSHDIMKMSDDVISVVEMQIAEIKAERQTGQSTDSKHGQECQREQHGGIETNRATPQRNEQTGQNDH